VSRLMGEIGVDILGGRPPALATATRGDAMERTIAAAVPPNGAGPQGTLPSPSGTSRDGGAGAGLKPPASAVGNVAAPQKPPVQRKRP